MWCGAALSCLLSVPQAVRVLRAERLDGISAATYVIVLSNAAVWAAWALLTSEYAAGVPGLINGPAAILILRRLMITRRKRRNYKSESSLLVRAPGNGNVSATAAYSRAQWLDSPSNTMMLSPKASRLVARVTTSDPLALPVKAGWSSPRRTASTRVGHKVLGPPPVLPPARQFSRYPPSGAPRHGLVSVPIATDPDSSSMLRTDSAVAPLQAAGPGAC
jgi:uncharacterized protein with PQ loop repeat